MAKKSEPIRIAHIVGKWVGGGVEAVIMNYYRHIDRTKIQFDFLCDEDSTNIPYEEIESLGGRVIIIPPYQKVFKYIKELKIVLKEGQYKIVHSHINTLSVFPLYAAKKAGVPVRIAHSHSTTNKKEWKKNLMKLALRPFAKTFATDYFACSELAGRWQFGEKLHKKNSIYIMNNAIDSKKFMYDKKIRLKKRKELGINNNEVIIGHVGRFVTVKNHIFLLKIFENLKRQNSNCKLLLVGQGPLEEKIKEEVKQKKLDNDVIFLGQRNDIEELYQAMDFFVLPSLYEGLGMVLIEAQCAGLPCLASTEVPEIVKISNKIDFLDLSSDIKIWTMHILENINKYTRDAFKENITNYGYDIATEVLKLEKKYMEFNNKKENK